jgi:hypothetical protein
VLTDARGFFTRAEAAELGYDDRAVTRSVRAKLWHRFRRGYYSFADDWQRWDEIERHRVRSNAVLHSLGDRVALSHVSAVVTHELPTWGLDLSRVHVTRTDGGPGRIEGDVVHHEGLCLGDDVEALSAGLVVRPVRAALETGSRAGGGDVGVVLLDALLHQGLATEHELEQQFHLMQHWPFMRSMHIPVRVARPGAASVGESLGRCLFRRHRLPEPELQFEVRDRDGQLIGTTDWGWPEHRLLGEFDGRVKYGRLLEPGQDPGEVVFAEKRREDLLREVTAFGMVRLIWGDLSRELSTARRVRHQLDRRAG